MATRKPKPDPLHARPDGIRLRSAWLTKTFAAAEAAAAAVREPPPDPNTYDDFILLQLNPQGTAFLPGNTVEANAAFLEQMSGLGSTGWACLVDWHGDAALPWLEKRLDARLKSNQNTIRLIACLASPAAQDVLLRHLDLPEVRTAVAESAARWPLDTLRRLLALDPRRGQPAAELVQRLLFQHPDWLAALEAQLDNEGDDADAVAQRKTLARLLAPLKRPSTPRPPSCRRCCASRRGARARCARRCRCSPLRRASCRATSTGRGTARKWIRARWITSFLAGNWCMSMSKRLRCAPCCGRWSGPTARSTPCSMARKAGVTTV